MENNKTSHLNADNQSPIFLEKMNFVELMVGYKEKDLPANNIEFYIKAETDETTTFHPLDTIQSIYLCLDGYLKYNANTQDRFVLHSRELAINICAKLKELCICQEEYDSISFDIEIHRIGKPKHLFTKEEIGDLILKGDDTKNNQLVVDEDGYVQMLPLLNRGQYYPVYIEPFFQGNNYVGEALDDKVLEGFYGLMLDLWHSYLLSGESRFGDCLEEPLKPEEKDSLIEKIMAYY